MLLPSENVKRNIIRLT